MRDARSARDVYAQDRTRLENQILAAQQTIHALTTQLGIADKKLTSLEDLIGEVRTRMHARGLHTSPPVRRPFPSLGAPIPAAIDGPTNTQPPCEFSILSFEFTLLTQLAACQPEPSDN